MKMSLARKKKVPQLLLMLGNELNLKMRSSEMIKQELSRKEKEKKKKKKKI
jgi:hypothetical protein